MCEIHCERKQPYLLYNFVPSLTITSLNLGKKPIVTSAFCDLFLLDHNLMYLSLHAHNTL